MTRDGTPALANRTEVAEEARIVTGFTEPHFLAGFGGGAKGFVPRAAGLKTVMNNPAARNLGDR